MQVHLSSLPRCVCCSLQVLSFSPLFGSINIGVKIVIQLADQPRLNESTQGLLKRPCSSFSVVGQTGVLSLRVSALMRADFPVSLGSKSSLRDYFHYSWVAAQQFQVRSALVIWRDITLTSHMTLNSFQHSTSLPPSNTSG